MRKLRDDCTSRNRSIDVRDGNGVPWLEATFKFLASESTSDVPGAQTIMARLTDVLFIQILRAYIAQNAEDSQSWLNRSACRGPDSRCVSRKWPVSRRSIM